MLSHLFFGLCLSFGQDSSHVYVDNFDQSDSLEWHSKNKNPELIYNIISLDSIQYLSAYSDANDNFLIKEIKVDLVKYPYLNWKWRANILPDESVKAFCDVAACVNVVLKASKWRPRTIKYSWSTTLAKDSLTQSPFAIWPSRCDIRVVKTGPDDLGEWHTEKINVLEDYKKFYNKKKVKKLEVEAFVIMTDSNNTGTKAAADYDDILPSHPVLTGSKLCATKTCDPHLSTISIERNSPIKSG